MTTGQLKKFKKHPEAGPAGAARTMLRDRQTFGLAKSGALLEEFSYTADRELPMANTEKRRNRSGMKGP